MGAFWQPTPYALLTGGAFLVSALLAFYTWHQRALAGALQMTLLMTANATWLLFYTLELLSVHQIAQLAFSKLAYSGIVIVSPAWLLFAITYSGRRNWLNTRRQLLLWLIPAAIFSLAITNESHNLLWQNITQIQVGQFRLLHYDYGPVFWVHAIYSYILLFVGTSLMLQTGWRTYKQSASQAWALLIGVLPPWIINAFYLSGHPLWPRFDASPLALTLSGLLIITGIYRYHLINIIPVAAETILDTLQDGVLVINPSGTIMNSNRAAGRLLGRSPEDLVGQYIGDVLPRQIITDIHPNASGEFFQDGRYLQTSIARLQSHPGYRLVYLHDITQSRLDALRVERQNQYLLHLNTLTQIILSTENEEEILPELAQHAVALFQADQCIIIGVDGQNNTLNILASTFTGQLNTDVLLKMAQNALSGQKPHVYRNISAQLGTCAFQSALALPLISNRIRLGTLIIGYTTSARFDREILLRGEQVAAQISLALAKIHLLQEVRHLAVIDDLTNAYNHRFLNITGQHIFAQARRYQENLSLLMFDLDHFKEINDQFGHLNGDLALTQVARRCQNSIRDSDWLIRYGGDEFIVLLPYTNIHTALQIGQRIQKAIVTKAIPLQQGNLHLSISMGIASLTDDITSLDGLIHHADEALYRAKNNGRNQIAIYSPAEEGKKQENDK